MRLLREAASSVFVTGNLLPTQYKEEAYTIAARVGNPAHGLRWESPNYPFGAGVMDRDKLRRLIGRLKQALRRERRLTLEEFHQLLQLSRAILEYGQMIQDYRGYAAPYAIVEVPELALRFRETPRTIQDALALLGGMGQAEPLHLRGCWKLRPAVAPRSEENDTGDVGAA